MGLKLKLKNKQERYDRYISLKSLFHGEYKLFGKPNRINYHYDEPMQTMHCVGNSPTRATVIFGRGGPIRMAYLDDEGYWSLKKD